ncbi:DUF5333 domain-containing protein [Paracoccus spongiarum]|uniref:DUF5333 domain-containing protein n=1 Tax=Paracoccus spongiarum TaxID=3064387 RepID=A0ABT9J7L1_9RHOB|nr:DUF5333 domain-containing protein [Paracoccus sp. 2205BS29-5]MDP5305796.1 DUF5333 domain-containing protein [Paracoccus sp. 2205BS29-5]
MTPIARRRMVAALAATITLAATPALALEPLSQEKYINDRLVAARVADRIRRECPSIEGRVVYAFMKARELKAYARGKGYSEAEIEAFLDSRADKDRIYAVAEDYMARKGVAAGDAESFCRLGRDEIARNTVTGSLLSAR